MVPNQWEKLYHLCYENLACWRTMPPNLIYANSPIVGTPQNFTPSSPTCDKFSIWTSILSHLCSPHSPFGPPSSSNIDCFTLYSLAISRSSLFPWFFLSEHPNRPYFSLKFLASCVFLEHSSPIYFYLV